MIKLNVKIGDYETGAKVKELGAWWNKSQKFWYVPDGVDSQRFLPWLQVEDLPFDKFFANVGKRVEVPDAKTLTETMYLRQRSCVPLYAWLLRADEGLSHQHRGREPRREE